MKKRNVISFFLLAILLAGCSLKKNDRNIDTASENNDNFISSNEENNLTETNSLLDNQLTTFFPETYTYQGDNISINIENIPPKAFFSEGILEYQSFQCEKLAQDIMKDEIISMEDDGTYVYMMTNNYMYGEPGYKCCEYSCADFTSLFFESFEYDKYQYSFYDVPGHVEYNIDKYKVKKEFSFGSDYECLDKVSSYLASFGIDTDDMKVDICYLDSNILRSEEKYLENGENNYVNENKYEWSEEDDSYMFYFTSTYCDLEYHNSYNMYGNNCKLSNASIQVCYGKNGITFLKIEKPKFNDNNKKVKLMEFEDVMEVLIEHYDSILTKDRYFVDSARLVCDVDVDGNLRPVWVVGVETYVEDCDYSIYVEQRIDAADGKWWFKN